MSKYDYIISDLDFYGKNRAEGRPGPFPVGPEGEGLEEGPLVPGGTSLELCQRCPRRGN